MDQIRVGVIGVGNMGRNHLRLYSEMPEFNLVGFYDPSPAFKGYGKMYGIISFPSIESLLDNVDAVSVVAPSSLHREIAHKVAGMKKHALVEKPLALSAADAAGITDAFNENGVILMVGHVERFNPVIRELEKIIKAHDVIAIDIRRCSPWGGGRIADVDVIHDLMIHDIDIVAGALAPLPIKNITAVGRAVRSERHIDYAQAIVEYEDSGLLASITASRITEDKIREITVHARSALIRADLLNRTLTLTRQTNYSSGAGGAGGEPDALYRQENITEKVFVAAVEPLRQELLEFARCVGGGVKPNVSGEASVRALEVLEMISARAYGGAAPGAAGEKSAPPTSAPPKAAGAAKS
ncbi:MAG: Gfo/Idh/MocA family oxidoreductase [Clostridiales bacterium]|jgi:predicted dehydrogenase|nr:Gfo/Idh/MocA family oxidoreductase [Clostridiales bacterium]